MFALIGLIFLVLKIGVYATVYSFLVVGILYLISRRSNNKWIKTIASRKVISFFILGFCLSVFFFFRSFSYRNYSGLGDYFCIPIGYGYQVSSIDACDQSFIQIKTEDYRQQIFIKNFFIADEKVCGEFLGYNSTNCVNCYFVFESSTGKIKEFSSRESFLNYASFNKLSGPDQFTPFLTAYNTYWEEHNTWFLPY